MVRKLKHSRQKSRTVFGYHKPLPKYKPYRRRSVAWVSRLKASKGRRRRYLRKARIRRRRIKDGFITHSVKGLSAVKFGNRVTNANNTSSDPYPRQMDTDFALFNVNPLPYDPYLPWETLLNIGDFHGDSTVNDLNVPNTGSMPVLPTLLRASAFWDMDSQLNALAQCFEEFRVKTAVLEITLPDVMEIPDTNVPTVNNNLFLMWRFNDDIKPPNVRSFMRAHFPGFEVVDNWRKMLPFANAPDLDEVLAMASEEHRNAAGSNWHRVRLTPGKAVKIKWHPKCWMRNRVGNMQQDVLQVNESGSVKTYYFSNPVPNPFGRPGRGWIDTDAMQCLDETTPGLSIEDDVFFTGPTILLLDTSHERFATYNTPNVTVQSSVFQSQFKLQCKYYYKLQFRKVKRFDDNNIRDGYDNGQ